MMDTSWTNRFINYKEAVHSSEVKSVASTIEKSTLRHQGVSFEGKLFLLCHVSGVSFNIGSAVHQFQVK